jgi:hypothetical protein
MASPVRWDEPIALPLVGTEPQTFVNGRRSDHRPTGLPLPPLAIPVGSER